MKNDSFRPKWSENWLTDPQLDQISEAVKIAESTTSAEIVPILVRGSSTTGHVPLLLAALQLVIISSLGLDFFEYLIFENLYFNLFLVFIALLFFTGILSKSDWICRLLTPAEDQRKQVELRATLEFYNCETHTTRHNTGIMIFVSLLERQVVVLADHAISKINPPETWQNIVNDIVKSIKQKDLAAGIVAGIEDCGKILDKDFPIEEDDTNELSNQILIRD